MAIRTMTMSYSIDAQSYTRTYTADCATFDEFVAEVRQAFELMHHKLAPDLMPKAEVPIVGS
jgi:hypothetical protein